MRDEQTVGCQQTATSWSAAGTSNYHHQYIDVNVSIKLLLHALWGLFTSTLLRWSNSRTQPLYPIIVQPSSRPNDTTNDRSEHHDVNKLVAGLRIIIRDDITVSRCYENELNPTSTFLSLYDVFDRSACKWNPDLKTVVTVLTSTKRTKDYSPGQNDHA